VAKIVQEWPRLAKGAKVGQEWPRLLKSWVAKGGQERQRLAKSILVRSKITKDGQRVSRVGTQGGQVWPRVEKCDPWWPSVENSGLEQPRDAKEGQGWSKLAKRRPRVAQVDKLAKMRQ
jgi:hypothetical protein